MGLWKCQWQMADHNSPSPPGRLLKMYQEVDAKPPSIILNEGESVAL
ncbi:MAG: hypothetical protein VYE47_10085 [Pseudomonadota bacterium]|nr:hypothetical protein [Pseudomonadota bacterium]